MSNQAPTPAAPAEGEPATPEPTETPAETPAKVLTPEQLLEANRAKNAEAKNLRDRLRAAEAERDALKSAADALKTDEQREADRITSLEEERNDLAKQLADLQRQALITQVQKATGLPDALVDRLRGTTAEELTEDAKNLVALIPPAAPAPPAPTPNPGQQVPAAGLVNDRQASAKAFLATVPGLNR